MNELLEALAPKAPFLIGIVLAFLVVYKFAEQTKRVTDAILNGLQANAQRYAFAWAIGCGYAVLASLQSLADEATRMGWVWIAVAAKVIQPGLTAGLLFANKYFTAPGDPGSETKTKP